MESTFYPIIDSDFSELEGTSCYCSEDAAAQIRRKISSLPLKAVHLLGTGDYHYLSLFWIERLREPFTLVLFDNHPDDQATAFGGDLLSCGSWVSEVRRLPHCQGSIWINGRDVSELPRGCSIYISIDLDVLTEDYARTDWDQGPMKLDALKDSIAMLLDSCNILGVDICGGNTIQKGASAEDLAINAGTVEALCGMFK